jgi:hypothetical protein
MAQYYTLDEAAQKLGLPPDEFKRRTKTEWTSLTPLRDGATLRYRAADIDELARSLGAASDPGLSLGPVGSRLDDSSQEASLSVDAPLDFGSDSGGSDDIFSLSSGEPANNPGKKPGDSDVRLDLSPADGGRKATGDLALGTGSGRLTAPKVGGPGSARISPPPPADDDSDSSEFELRLDADSDSLDINLAGDGSDEVDLAAPNPSLRKGPQSGINLARPADSGVNLEKARPAADDNSDDFELALDAPGPTSGRLGPRTGPLPRVAGVDSSSEFELTLDDSSESNASFVAAARDEADKGDIFETDFDLPAVDESGSEVVAVDAGDDFEVAVDEESGSEVVAVEDEPVELTSDDIEDEAPVGRAFRGVAADDADDAPFAAPGQVVVGAAPSWGPLPAAVLLPSLVVLFLGTLMSYEALQGMWGYHQPSKPAGSLVRGLAELVGGKVAD